MDLFQNLPGGEETALVLVRAASTRKTLGDVFDHRGGMAQKQAVIHTMFILCVCTGTHPFHPVPTEHRSPSTNFLYWKTRMVLITSQWEIMPGKCVFSSVRLRLDLSVKCKEPEGVRG